MTWGGDCKAMPPYNIAQIGQILKHNGNKSANCLMKGLPALNATHWGEQADWAERE